MRRMVFDTCASSFWIVPLLPAATSAELICSQELDPAELRGGHPVTRTTHRTEVTEYRPIGYLEGLHRLKAVESAGD